MAKSNAEFIDDLRQIAENSRDSIRMEPLPESLEAADRFDPAAEAETPLFSRKFGGRIDYSWRIASFSSLTSTGIADVDLPDRDIALNLSAPALMTARDDEVTGAVSAEDTLFSFPRGTRAGTFFHDVLENYDFATEKADELSNLVAKKLQQYGFDQSWRAIVCRALESTLSTKLRSDLPQLMLKSVAMSDRANEMEFYFPLNRVSTESLAALFKNLCHTRRLKTFSMHLDKLEFAPARGFMKGYIDLVFQYQDRFYLVDWKSNHLGNDPQEYNQDVLNHVMQAELYILQYHLYTLALHRHLQHRKPAYRYEKDFGGVFYIFLRGVDVSRGPEYGIYYDLPDPDLIQSLGETLIAGKR
jgi:exodeoxyribonuclease V beta subunit